MARGLLVLMAAVSLTLAVLGAIALWHTRYLVGAACLSVGAGSLFGLTRELRRPRGTDDA
jgi:hypothetical protein